MSRGRKNYYVGILKRFDGIGLMLNIDPPFTTVRRSWSFELKLGWFKFWYIKEKEVKP